MVVAVAEFWFVSWSAGASRHSRESVEDHAAGDRDVETCSLSDHRNLDANVRRPDLLLGDAMPIMTEENHRAADRGLRRLVGSLTSPPRKETA